MPTHDSLLANEIEFTSKDNYELEPQQTPSTNWPVLKVTPLQKSSNAHIQSNIQSNSVEMAWFTDSEAMNALGRCYKGDLKAVWDAAQHGDKEEALSLANIYLTKMMHGEVDTGRRSHYLMGFLRALHLATIEESVAEFRKHFNGLDLAYAKYKDPRDGALYGRARSVLCELIAEKQSAQIGREAECSAKGKGTAKA